MGRIVRSATYFVAFPLAYALAILAGRATRLGGGEISLVWPAAAVATIWMLAAHQRGPRERAAHAALLAATTFFVNLTTGASVPLTSWFVLVNVVLAVVTVEVLTYRRREVHLRDPADLARLVAAVAVGNCCGAFLAAGWFVVVNGDPAAETFALFAVRNAASALVGVSIWLRLTDITWSRPRVTVLGALEALVAGGVVVAVFLSVFWLTTGVPMAFIALVPAMWVALRYSTTVSTLLLAVAGPWIIAATLLDHGALIVPELQERALLAQSLVGSLAIVVLALALYRDSRARLISELEDARDTADRDSELLAAVLDSIHDSVILTDAAGQVVLRNARAGESGHVDHVVSASREPMSAAGPTERRDLVVEAEDSRIIELTTAPLARQSPFTVVAFRDVTEERVHARELQEARDLFAGVLQAASEQAIVGTDATGHITVFNIGAERLTGWTADEVIGHRPHDFSIFPEVSSRAAELGVPIGFEVFTHNVTPQAAEVREWTYLRRDGSPVAVSLAVSEMTDHDGGCMGYIGVATDITERKAAEQALAESEERFRLAFDTAPMGMFMFDVTPENFGRVTRCNQAMADVLGSRPDDVLQMTVTDLDGLENHSETATLEQLLSLRVGQTFDAETSFRRADGDTVWGLVSASVVAPRGSEPYGICLVEDITSRKRVEDELHYLASHDPLTGLANRALFMGRIDKALADADRAGSSGVGLIFLDLDGFKTVNDTWGHAQGDEVLKVVADRLKAAIGPHDTAARLGGDEFAVLCPDDADVTLLHSAAERIRAELRRPVRLGAGRIYDQLSVSAGVVISQPGCVSETLLQRADNLMYFAKRSGKDCVTMGSEPAEEAALLREMQLTPDLDRAVDLDEFAVHFQPIVDLRTGECVAAEALLRWQHPERGLLCPDAFLTVAEASRHMPAIGRGVLNEACRQARSWAGAAAGSAVHVNVSGRQIEVGDLRADVLGALDVSGLDPRRLVLELTETHAGRVAASIRDDLDMLRELGIRIAIDDVGTGFSGLVKIIDLPIDILKISRQFIAGITDDARCAAITKAIVGLGSSLGLTVIAEGIERQDQRDLLIEWGCELGQGYLFGKARPVADGIKSPLSLFHHA
ncbi:bifunctional diguanylate cyclase/phosphodiesterase [Mycolicibacterium psychrotolerans]|uniref:GGDEF domain-containing protein n=1 Tax=Mycolicibacterium psychrotolerans TaxID=216929 RepID=A0A7I7M671_9MYCO|nr:EAL domain-containing protein [Mycolicibacterium psychrotolerans]BBX67510.1 hypothetical protein MPSYJ_09710 [Mycolicibacterium psychrotolerans]